MSNKIITQDSMMGLIAALHTSEGTFTGMVIAADTNSTTLWDVDNEELHVVFDEFLIGMTLTPSDEIRKFVDTVIDNIQKLNGIRVASDTANDE